MKTIQLNRKDNNALFGYFIYDESHNLCIFKPELGPINFNDIKTKEEFLNTMDDKLIATESIIYANNILSNEEMTEFNTYIQYIKSPEIKPVEIKTFEIYKKENITQDKPYGFFILNETYNLGIEQHQNKTYFNAIKSKERFLSDIDDIYFVEEADIDISDILNPEEIDLFKERTYHCYKIIQDKNKDPNQEYLKGVIWGVLKSSDSYEIFLRQLRKTLYIPINILRNNNAISSIWEIGEIPDDLSGHLSIFKNL